MSGVPEVRLVLRLVPVLAADGSVAHQVSLHPPDDPAADSPGGARFAIRVAFTDDPGPDGRRVVAHAATITPLDPPTSPPDPDNPWGHAVDRSREAARAVLAAAPEDRRARLVELVTALTT